MYYQLVLTFSVIIIKFRDKDTNITSDKHVVKQVLIVTFLRSTITHDTPTHVSFRNQHVLRVVLKMSMTPTKGDAMHHPIRPLRKSHEWCIVLSNSFRQCPRIIVGNTSTRKYLPSDLQQNVSFLYRLFIQ